MSNPLKTNATEFKSQNIMDMFGKLSNKLEKKLADFTKRQHLRTEELKAVYKAIKSKVQPR